MSTARRTTSIRPPARWLSPPEIGTDDIRALAARLGLPEPLCAFLLARGIQDPDDAKRFLRPEIAHLHEPSLLTGISRAAERVARAVLNDEVILIHGDYDVDGITSTAILTRTLRSHGARVRPFVPHRVRDGYDLSDAGVRAAREEGATLVITCDCGTAARAPVVELGRAGIDTIITDHHLPTGPLPDAFVVLNPRQPGCAYPDKDLVAAGVAFKLALAVQDELGADRGLVFQMLDLVALATVADVAHLRGENRVLVRHGLRQMKRSRWAGLRAMLRASGLDEKELTAGRIGFILGPRLNATGRIGRGQLGVELLLTDDDEEALSIARELEELNRKRQEMDRKALDQVHEQIDGVRFDDTFGIVLASEEWHPGIVGIVASRLVEETGRPTILVALENGIGKGSGRSIGAFDLHGALTQCSEHLLRYGGHRVAAGITIEAGRIPAFREAFNAVARERLTLEQMAAEVRIDLELPFADATEEFVRLLRHCEPHGMGNPAPVFVARGVHAEGTPRVLRGTTGVKTRLTHGSASLTALAWDFAHRLDTFDWRAPLDIVYRLERDDWNGRMEVQARVADVRQ
jgi:single-stranded-DNA-specific exonuclease